MDSVSLDELLERIKGELVKLGPIIELEVTREPEAENAGRLDRGELSH